MLKKLDRKLEQLSVKQLTVMTAISVVITLIGAVLISYVIKEETLAITLLIAFIVVCFCLIGRFLLFTLIEVDFKNSEKLALAKLKLQLSSEEYREVEFPSDIVRYEGMVSWEDENLARCLKIIKNLQVKHFAKISGDTVTVIAKDNDGQTIGVPDIYTPKFFRKNYIIK